MLATVQTCQSAHPPPQHRATSRAKLGKVFIAVLFLPHEVRHGGLDGFRPNLVAFLIRMKQVGHDVLAERAIGGQELRTDVEIEHRLVVGQLRDDRIGLFVDLPQFPFLSAPRGKIASTSTLVCGNFVRSFSTIALTPAAISSGLLLPALFVPIISTASFGEIPSMFPWSNRQSTCCVWSPPMPRLTAFRLA